MALVTLAVLGAVWRWTPLGEWITHQRLVSWSLLVDPGWPRAAASIGAFVVGSLLMIPQTVLVLAAGLVFGPLRGALYGYVGTLVAAAATYLVGWLLGSRAMRGFQGSRVERVSRYLAERGIRTMFLIGLLPLAPFALVSLAAGASHIRFRDFFIGTALGVGPGILVVAGFGGQLRRVVQNPTPGQVALMVLLAVILVVMVFYGRRLVGRFFDGSSSEE